MTTTIILGPPGTGKTTTLIGLLSDYLAKGVSPSKIGFLSFTKQATEEAKGRAMEKFGLGKDDLPYFRTIHSLAFRQLGMNPRQVMGPRHYRELGGLVGVDISGYVNQEEGDAYGLPIGDRLLFISGLSRVRCQPLKDTWEDVGEDVDFWELEQFDAALRQYKLSNSLLDFTDMLESYEKKGPFPNLDVLFVDEAQDLSQLQWRIIKKMRDNASRTIISGDDDQSIFQWSGADVRAFIGIDGSTEVLNQSYRIPRLVHDTATRLCNSIVGGRRAKEFKPRESGGAVSRTSSLEDAPLHKGEWLILVRNGYMTEPIEEYCQLMGYHYSCKGKSPAEGEALKAISLHEKARKGLTLAPGGDLELVSKYSSTKRNGYVDAPWFEALDKIPPDEKSYFLSALRNGEKLTQKPRIRISTIHGAKGAEADNVLLYTDMSFRTYAGMEKDMDAETRVFYVGITRAKENLYIMEPQTERYFEI